jgi:membrane protease YdiL (CAAX protease family)
MSDSYSKQQAQTNVRQVSLWILPIITILIFFVGQILAVVPVLSTGLIKPEEMEQYPNILFTLLGPFSMGLALLFCWVRFYERTNLNSIGLQFGNNDGFNLATGSAIALLMGITSVMLIWMSGGYQRGENSTGLLAAMAPSLLLLIAFAVQASVEEICFRGWLLNRIQAKKGKVWAVVGSSAMFTLIHLLSFDPDNNNLTTFVIFVTMLMLFSVFLALMTLKLKSIWFACAWHVVWNWMFINLFGLPTTGISLDTPSIMADLNTNPASPIWLSGGTAGPENSVITLAILLVTCLVAWKKYKQTLAHN